MRLSRLLESKPKRDKLAKTDILTKKNRMQQKPDNSAQPHLQLYRNYNLGYDMGS
jgi:hypothetical protein